MTAASRDADADCYVTVVGCSSQRGFFAALAFVEVVYVCVHVFVRVGESHD